MSTFDPDAMTLLKHRFAANHKRDRNDAPTEKLVAELFTHAEEAIKAATEAYARIITIQQTAADMSEAIRIPRTGNRLTTARTSHPAPEDV